MRQGGPERAGTDGLPRGPRGRSGQQRDPQPGRDQLALAWLLAQGPDVVPIPGSRRPERIAENAAAAAAVLGPADLDRLARALPRAAWAGNRHSFAARGTVRSGC
jgi:hypothetical protein